jgi:2-desacetyl-2-hydroxyethyl bacteriochlorophyllide A dehydrogenase
MVAKTRAAVVTAPRKIEMRELPVPEIDEDSGLIHIELTGVCGVDWPAFTGARPDRFKMPLILGHEIVGRIERIGAKAAKRWNVKEGDRIVLEEYAPCGHCEYCLSGHYYMCGGMAMEKMYGFTSLDVAPGLWGGFSEFVYLDPQALVHKISDDVPPEVAPLYLAISNGIRWVQTEGRIGIGDTVVILGPGQLGLSCTVAAKEAGARCIIVTGRANDARRMEIARALGAHHTIDIDNEDDVVGRVHDLTEGRMADAVINVTSSSPAAAQQALELVKIHGIIVMAGGALKPAEGFYPDLLIRKEVTMKGVRGRTAPDLKKALRIIESGKYPLQTLSTHKFSIEETENALLTIGGEGERGAIHISVVNRFN